MWSDGDSSLSFLSFTQWYHNNIDLYSAVVLKKTAPQKSGTLRRCRLLEEVWHGGGGLWGLKDAQAMPCEKDPFPWVKM